jgi:hypothetical protein
MKCDIYDTTPLFLLSITGVNQLMDFHENVKELHALCRKVAVSSLYVLTEYFSIYIILPAALRSEAYSASKRIEYQRQK